MGYDWSQGAQGAAGGAAAGTAILPGWGTAIGAGVGLLSGFWGSDGKQEEQDQLKALAQGYGNRTAPQAGYSQFRQNQAALIAQLEGMARGDGPSAAQQQMQQAMDRAAGAQASAAAGAGGRGVNAGAALRNATNQTAAIQSQGARDTSVLRAQEQANAVSQLGQAIAQGRQADEGVNVANMGSSLQTMGLDQNGQLQALMAALGLNQPGMGTQLLGAGATAAPVLAAGMAAQNKAQAQPGAGQNAAYNDPSQYWQGTKKQGSLYGL